MTTLERTTIEEKNEEPPMTISSHTMERKMTKGRVAMERKTKSHSRSTFVTWLGTLIRLMLIDLPVFLLLVALACAHLLHHLGLEYFRPQLLLMKFPGDNRNINDVTYYERFCDESDISATSIDELVIAKNATKQEAMEHMLVHGVSLYQDLLSDETASTLREWIAEENHKREGFSVISNKHRYSWGIDVGMHPALLDYWRELASNEQLVDAMTEIIGPDPAIIEFTAITAAYGAGDQHDHQDVVPSGNGVKYGRTFIPSYSLFITLQDTTYDMGATHVCPGSHQCASNTEIYCPHHNLAVSGKTGVWKRGWGAFVNQQTTHKGMGHFREGGQDRVVLIATFAPRPQTSRFLETRMIGHGGSYSLSWEQWGHTFSDFAHADTRMTHTRKIFRSLGLIKGNGWNLPTVASMRIANEQAGYSSDELEEFIEEGGFWFLPQSWQQFDWEDMDEEVNSWWYDFLMRTTDTCKRKFSTILLRVMILLFSVYALLDVYSLVIRKDRRSGSFVFRAIRRAFLSACPVLLVAFFILRTVDDSNWAKDVKSAKAFHLATRPIPDEPVKSTLPGRFDILVAPHYASGMMASYNHILDYNHPGNVEWNRIRRKYAVGYVQLPELLQRDLCKNEMAQEVGLQQRFLQYSAENTWVVMNDEAKVERCHEDMVRESDPLIDTLALQLTALRADTQHGRWFGKSIHANYIPALLDDLWLSVVPTTRYATATSDRDQSARKRHSISIGGTRSNRNVPYQRNNYKRTYALPVRATPSPPEDGSWLQEGEEVEAMMGCNYGGWSRGVIEYMFTDNMSVTVRYYDGHVDHEIRLSCVRTFEPFQVGEDIEVQPPDSDEWFVGKVAFIHDRDVLDIQTETRFFTRASKADVRRPAGGIESDGFSRGDKIISLYEGSEWFPAHVADVNTDGTYAVLYTDGDYESHVPSSYIRRRQ